jgi:hypothetical protein
MRRPHLRHRRVVHGELVASLCELARRSPAPIRADSVGGPVGVALGSTALPAIVRGGLVGAADEQRHGGFGVAVARRKVQRCVPAGPRRRNRHSRRPTTPPDGPRGMGAPAVVVLGVQVGARDDELLDDRVMVVGCRKHQGGGPIPAHGQGIAAGVSPDQRIPIASSTRSNPSQFSGYGWGSRGAAAEGSFFKNSGDAD